MPQQNVGFQPQRHIPFHVVQSLDKEGGAVVAVLVDFVVEQRRPVENVRLQIRRQRQIDSDAYFPVGGVCVGNVDVESVLLQLRKAFGARELVHIFVVTVGTDDKVGIGKERQRYIVADGLRSAAVTDVFFHRFFGYSDVYRKVAFLILVEVHAEAHVIKKFIDDGFDVVVGQNVIFGGAYGFVYDLAQRLDDFYKKFIRDHQRETL